MACCPAEDRADGGYATAAALTVSLAVAILAAALVMRGVAMLKLARADLRRSQAEYALSGAHVLAAERLLNSSGSGRLAWNEGGLESQEISLLAEAEASKLPLALASQLDDKALAALGAAEPDTTRVRLARLEASRATPDELEAADGALAWRACVTSVISPWGSARGFNLDQPRLPNREPGGARAGQVWRVRASTPDGWVDERIVRLIGRAEGPSAIIWRRFGRGAGKGVTCDRIIEISAAADGDRSRTPATP